MINKKIIATICISAYNEEKNIGKLLDSLFLQKETYFQIKQYRIYADGCTDNTIGLIRKFTNKKIKLIISKARLGQPKHMDSALRQAEGDVIVFLDADILPVRNTTIDSLIAPFYSDNKVGITSGHSVPKQGRTFIERAVNVSVKAYDDFRLNIRGGDNAYCVEGRILAVKTELARKIRIPKGTFVNDAYLYFASITLGYTFKFVKSAEIWYRSPATLEDQVKQNKRFVAREALLTPMFGNIVKQEYSISRVTFYIALVKEFLKHPVLCGSIYFINMYCKVITPSVVNEMSDAWPIALSTKGDL